MAKNRNIGLIVGIVVLLLLTGVSLFIAFSPVYDKKLEYNETEEHSATVAGVITKNKSYEISVTEYSCSLIIKKDEVVNERALLDLNIGENIIFNLPKFYEEALSDSRVQSIYIVSLKTNNTDIVTLESHNSIAEKSLKKITITATVFASLFFCGVAVCLFFLLKPKRNTADLSR